MRIVISLFWLKSLFGSHSVGLNGKAYPNLEDGFANDTERLAEPPYNQAIFMRE